MGNNNNDTKITITVVTTAIAASLFLIAIMITPQSVYALSRYDASAANPEPTADVTKEKTNQQLQLDDLGITAKPAPTTATLPTIPTVGCAMDTIENFESFLDCLGAK